MAPDPHDSHSLEQEEPKQLALTLPVLIFGLVEVRRLRRELQALEEYMRSAELRQPGTQAALPRMSRLLDALAAENHCNLLLSDDRQVLANFLQEIQEHAPTIHMSFASDPSSAFTAKVVSWLRANIHPAVLLQVGLQPTLAAGCMVRTNNKQFDFSLREAFTEHKPLLLESFEKEAGDIAPAPDAVQAAVTAETPVTTAAAPAAQPPSAAPQSQTQAVAS